jgi:hypothetical protein
MAAAKKMPIKTVASSGHITNIKQSILEIFDIYKTNSGCMYGQASADRTKSGCMVYGKASADRTKSGCMVYGQASADKANSVGMVHGQASAGHIIWAEFSTLEVATCINCTDICENG